MAEGVASEIVGRVRPETSLEVSTDGQLVVVIRVICSNLLRSARRELADEKLASSISISCMRADCCTGNCATACADEGDVLWRTPAGHTFSVSITMQLR